MEEEVPCIVPLEEKTEEICENELEEQPSENKKKVLNMSPGAVQLRSWLNKTLRIEMTDGRVLIGVFLCTDRDANVILGSCSEFLPPDSGGASNEELRMLGLVMIPGKHIVNVHLDANEFQELDLSSPLPVEVRESEVT